MSDHQKFVATALRLIAKHGRDVNFKRLSSTEANVDKPWRGTSLSPVSFGPFKAVFVPFRGLDFGSLYLDSSLFKEVEQVCLCAGGQADLETMHIITDSSKDYKIEWVRRLRPGDQTVLYVFGVGS